MLSTLAEPNYRPVVNYIDMINESQSDPMKLQLDVAPLTYIPVIQGCKHFENGESLNEIWSLLQQRDAEIGAKVNRSAVSQGQYLNERDRLRAYRMRML